MDILQQNMEVETIPTFSQRFKRLREKKGWTQEETAERLGVSRPSIAGYESKNRTPRQEMLQRIADLFGVTTDYLLGRKEDVNLVEPTQQKSNVADAVAELIQYLELELSNEEIVEKMNFQVDHIRLSKEEAMEFVQFIRVRRLMKKHM